MPTVLKSGSLNLLESSGPVQACNGIAIPRVCVCVQILQCLYLPADYQQSECLIIFKICVLGSFLLEFPSLLTIASLQLEKEVLCAMFVHIKCMYHFAV